MLNETRSAERAAGAAGVAMAPRHPDVKNVRRIPTLLVRLCADGRVGNVELATGAVTLWTLRDGQHNSFPFVQPKRPLWQVEDVSGASAGSTHDQWVWLVSLTKSVAADTARLDGWPGPKLLKRLRERRLSLAPLKHEGAAVVPETLDRVLAATDPKLGEDPQRLAHDIAAMLTVKLEQNADAEWVEAATAILVTGGGALMFDAEIPGQSILDPGIISRVSAALDSSRVTPVTGSSTRCGLTGEADTLVKNKFPQPNIPVLGQTFLFARNKDIPSAGRYGRFAADTMPVGEKAADRMASALVALTAPERKGKTWHSLPGEGAKQTDLLIAFVDVAPDEDVVSLLIGAGDDDDFSGELPTDGRQRDDVAAFERNTERLIDAVKGRITDPAQHPRLQFTVLRKVDPANRKVVLSGTPTVAEFHAAALDWYHGERNVPPWLEVPIPRKGVPKPVLTHPPHVAPLGLIRFSKQMYIRGGRESQELAGLSAAAAMEVFLATANDDSSRLAARALRMVLRRRTVLLSGLAHALRRGLSDAKEFNRLDALRAVTVIGVLLHKSGRGVGYMSEPAFQLGQLLAVADVVHAGYCADVRGGALPPSLLGNQVFAMAQRDPARALAVLCQRWKPYAGWAAKVSRERVRIDRLRDGGDDKQRGWAVTNAVSQARRLKPIAEQLHSRLDSQVPDDAFRAELLLGYIAGLPKEIRDDATGAAAADTATSED